METDQNYLEVSFCYKGKVERRRVYFSAHEAVQAVAGDNAASRVVVEAARCEALSALEYFRNPERGPAPERSQYAAQLIGGRHG